VSERPTAQELAEAILEFLGGEILPTLTDHRLRFRMLVAMNALGIVYRELEALPAADDTELRELAQQIRADNVPPGTLQRIKADVDRLQKENPDAPGPVPAELVTASGSGLDPHLSPEGARWQVPRVAKARGRTVAEIQTLVDRETEGRTLGFLGEPTVNVLRLNLALDRELRAPAEPRP